MQGFIRKQKPIERESKLKVRNNAKVEVDFVGTNSLNLESSFELVLENIFYVSFFKRNLVLVSIMDKLGYHFSIGNKMVNLFLNSKILGEFKLVDSLYSSCLAPNNEYNCMNIENTMSKRSFIKEKSSLLWHKRLGHISNERDDRLIKDGISPSLDFGDLDTYVDCIRGKLTKTKKNRATHGFDLLEIMHTDIRKPLISTICGDKYFITFIDDFSYYGYLYLIKKKI